MFKQTNFDITPLTTFGIKTIVNVFYEANTTEEVIEFVSDNSIPKEKLLIIGGGSNLLFCDNYDGIVLKPAIKGISIIERNEGYAIVEAGAGEVWDDLVSFCVENNLYGIENLSYIPGNVGACPVQNIGAYGTEVQQVIDSVETVEIATGNTKYFNNEECKFGYRDSIFKNELKGKYIITNVRFKLSTIPRFNIEYKDVKEKIAGKGDISSRLIREAIIDIRKHKLPAPSQVGNAGSFFKNPIVDPLKASTLKELYHNIVTYALPDGTVKLAAGWLIDQAGWKGYRKGDAGVHPNQALVLVNYGNATGNDIARLAREIQDSIKLKFGVDIEPEVNKI